MRLITAIHIVNWAAQNRRDCQGTLPILMRRLVRATATNVESIDFPGGDSISDEGWDGRVTCSSECSYVPEGISGWEIGTDQSPGAKADADYVKRSADALDLDASLATYVCVTPRPWPRRHTWARTRRAEGVWKDVRVIAAGDIEQWLEGTPAVALWLARHLGLVPASGLQSIEGWWEEWAAGTRPQLTSDMLLGAREREIENARSWLVNQASSLEVQGDHPDEALAFLAAASTRWSDAERETLLSRCVVATTEDAFRSVAEWPTPLFIAAPADMAQPTAGRALQKGHHLFLAVGRSLAARGAGPVRLSRLDGMSLRQAIEATGMSREESATAVVECGRSVAVLRRRRAAIEAIRRPVWASPANGASLVPALLAGAWSETIRRTDSNPLGPAPLQLLDREVVSGFGSSRDYEATIGPIATASATDDPPLRRAADVWTLTSPLDAWYLLCGFVGESDLKALAAAAIEVLGAPDPKYELTDDQQWMANVLGKQRQHSGWLRQGLAASLAIVANHGDGLGLRIPHGTARAYGAQIVATLLSRLPNWQAWASLSDVLPLLAEVAPDALLLAVEDLIQERPNEARLLMADGGGSGGTGECRHAALLWALERVAWHPDHLGTCLVTLARLHAMDPGGNWGNRPFGTLCDVLLGPGDPYTFADAATCLAAVDAVAASAPEVAWKLFLRAAEPLRSRIVRDPPSYLPARPDGWTPWASEQRRAFWTGLQLRLRLFIEAADRGQISRALKRLQFLPEDAQVAVADRLNDSVPLAGGDDPLWDAVRAALHRARSHYGPGRLAPAALSALESAYQRLAPADPIGRAAWLFQQQDPKLADGESEDWQQYHALLGVRRAEAAGALMESMEVAAVVAWAATLPNSYAFGVALADAVDPASELAVVRLLLSLARAPDSEPPPLLAAYARRRAAAQGLSWLSGWLIAAAALPDPVPALAALHCVSPSTSGTWQQVEACGPAVDQLYWRWTWPMPDETAASADWVYAIEKLSAVGRVLTALEVVARSKTPILPAAPLLHLCRAVMQTVNDGGADLEPNFSWRIERLFQHIDRAPDAAASDVAGLEWQYLPVLEHTRRGARLLHRELADDPAFFAQIVRLRYGRQDGTMDEDDARLTPEARSGLAELAYKLISDWKTPLPGQGSTGIDGVDLRRWVDEARRLGAEADRTAAGDRLIGTLMARFPVDPGDSAWPHGAVRGVLEALRNEDMESGFVLGVLNSRGVTSRGLRDGGAQERAEADRYFAWARTIRPTAPHTARLLARIADDYLVQARRHDEDAERDDLRC